LRPEHSHKQEVLETVIQLAHIAEIFYW